MHTKLDRPDDFDDASFPQARPLETRLDGYFLTFRKDGQNILRVNVEDGEALQLLHSLVAGIARCRMVPAELENLQDIIEGVIRGTEAGS